MMKLSRISACIIAATVTICLSGDALAAGKLFTNTTGNDLWSDPANWTFDAEGTLPAGLPGPGDDAIHVMAHDLILDAGTGEATNVNHGPWGPSGKIDILAGATLQTNWNKVGTIGPSTQNNWGHIQYGFPAGVGDGEAGGLNVGGVLDTGSIGVLNNWGTQRGENLGTTVGGDGVGSGILNIYDGEIETGDIRIKSTGLVNITGGALVMAGGFDIDGNLIDPESWVAQMEGLGRLTAYGGSGTFNIENIGPLPDGPSNFDGQDFWRVTAVPEPASIVLAGIVCSATLVRRRRSCKL